MSMTFPLSGSISVDAEGNVTGKLAGTPTPPPPVSPPPTVSPPPVSPPPTTSPPPPPPALSGSYGLVGSTVSPALYNMTDTLLAANHWDSLVSTSTEAIHHALLAQKWYFQEGNSPATIPGGASELLKAGCRLLVSWKPSKTLSQTQFDAFKASVAAWHNAGVDFKVILWQEPNTSKSNFAGGPSEYKAYCAYYGPAVRAVSPSIKMVYCPALVSNNKGQSALDFYPGDEWADEMINDFYASAYHAGTRLDGVAALCNEHKDASGKLSPIPLGIGEYGGSATTSYTVTPTDWEAYITYFISVFEGRVKAGYSNGEVIYWNGWAGATNDNILTASDFKCAGIRQLDKAINVATVG